MATDRAFNTVVAVGPGGELLGRYRKQHLFDALGWMESERLLAGDPADGWSFAVGDMRVGVMTCYDIRFPELARALVDDGATLLVVPSAWVAGPNKLEQWRALATARAIENVCYVAGAVQSPPSYTGESARQSSIPWGRASRGRSSSPARRAWRCATSAADERRQLPSADAEPRQPSAGRSSPASDAFRGCGARSPG